MSVLKFHKYNQPAKLSDILVFEIDPRWSREGGEFAPTSQNIPMGAVLSLDNEGRYVPFGEELSPAVEGENAKPAVLADKACAILASQEIEAGEEAQPCVVIRRGACVASANLFWLESVAEERKKTALGALASLGIVPKE